MPEIDTDLFQTLTLGGLALTLLLTLIALSSISRLRKRVEELGGTEGRAIEERAAVVEPEPRRDEVAAAAPVQETSEPEPEPARTSEQEQPAVSSAYAEHHDETSGAGATSASEVATSTATEEEPQEQPFERDGRWWFKRGDELLVYEESTGEWVAAGSDSPGGGAAAAQTSGAEQTQQFGGAASGEESSESSGAFWKCPSCGATNGSTATSCRMCFAARP